MGGTGPAPRLRPTAAPGVATATLAALLDGRDTDFTAVEAAAARLAGTRHAVLVGSARAGMAAILAARGVGAGDEVLVSSYTAPCVPAFLRARGLRVRLAAVCPRRLVVTGETVAAALGPQTRAVIATHVEGVTAPMAEIAAAVPPAVTVLEDAAHALGAEADGRPVGAHGAGAVHSFGKGKHLNTVFGGLVVTEDAAVAATATAARDALPPPTRARMLSAVAMELGVAAATHPRLYPFVLHPLIRAFDAFGIDLPTRLFEDDGRSAPPSLGRRPPVAWARLALAQLAALPAERSRRRALAEALRAGLRARGLRHQEAGGPGDHPLFVTLRAPRREALRRALLAEGQDTQPTWMRAAIGDDGGTDPEAEAAAQEGLYLPLHAGVDAAALLATLDRARARLVS